jgi:2-hydroxychromene-2-carboxylate isomerase
MAMTEVTSNAANNALEFYFDFSSPYGYLAAERVCSASSSSLPVPHR